MADRRDRGGEQAREQARDVAQREFDPRVRERVEGFRGQRQRCTGVALLAQAREVWQTLQAAEARHVNLGLSADGFPFARAQEELGRWRRGFSHELQAALTGAGSLEEPVRAELNRLRLVAERAPLTSGADLEVIRAGRGARRTA